MSIHGSEFLRIPLLSENRMPHTNYDGRMDNIKAKLADRLAAKGLESNETELFIKDVIRIVTDSPGSNLETIKGQLHLLGWGDLELDYRTFEIATASFEGGI